MSPNTNHRQVDASLPFECVESRWDLAVTTWEQLKAARRGFPVVIGNDESIKELVALFHDDSRTVEEILAVAATLSASREPPCRTGSTKSCGKRWSRVHPQDFNDGASRLAAVGDNMGGKTSGV